MAMVNGGIFKSKPYTLGEDESREYSMSICWGEVSRDVKVTCVNKPKAEFGICYHRKTFINCVVWGDSPFYQTACRLQRGDNVLVCGTYKKQTYNSKEGLKEYFDFTPSFLIPDWVITGMAKTLSDGDMENPDAFRGDDYPEISPDEFADSPLPF